MSGWPSKAGCSGNCGQGRRPCDCDCGYGAHLLHGLRHDRRHRVIQVTPAAMHDALRAADTLTLAPDDSSANPAAAALKPAPLRRRADRRRRVLFRVACALYPPLIPRARASHTTESAQ